MAVIIDISTSVDGFIAYPDGSAGPIHEWFFSGDEPTGEFFRTAGADTEALRDNLRRTGATVAGRATYDLVNGWEGNHPAGAPVVVVTHQPPASASAGRTPISFAGNVKDAVSSARQLAGHKDVFVMGGASVIQQTPSERRADYLQLHITPVALGSGIRLFDTLPDPVPMAIDRVIDGPGATHLRYRLTWECPKNGGWASGVPSSSRGGCVPRR